MQKIPTSNKTRIESGVTQFDDDWPGYFLRGDTAFHLAVSIQSYLDAPDALFAAILRGYAEDLEKVQVETAQQKIADKGKKD